MKQILKKNKTKWVKTVFISLISGLLILISITNCKTNRNNMESNERTSTSIDNETLKNIASKSIFFGHQSVGFDIIDGIEIITKNYPECELKTIESRELNGSGFFHSRIGENRDPHLKINDFVSFIKSGIADSIDIAFFKLCYIDINSNTNIAELFATYKTNIDSLKRLYPNITFIHVTSPLRAIDAGVKGLIKRILGKTSAIKDNLSRNQYNELIRNEYHNEPLFDIALWESTLQNKKRSYVKYKGKKVFQLANEYTNDGGHLNKNGGKFIAKKLIELISNL